jgi:hypothetical protein
MKVDFYERQVKTWHFASLAFSQIGHTQTLNGKKLSNQVVL